MTNQIDDPDSLNFDWEVTEFFSSSMKIEIDWKDSYQISAGLQRDVLVMVVLDPYFFFSANKIASIQVNSRKSIKVPKTMPNDS